LPFGSCRHEGSSLLSQLPSVRSPRHRVVFSLVISAVASSVAGIFIPVLWFGMNFQGMHDKEISTFKIDNNIS
jgi:hypothetical protein